jgi:hypothetical protein
MVTWATSWTDFLFLFLVSLMDDVCVIPKWCPQPNPNTGTDLQTTVLKLPKDP